MPLSFRGTGDLHRAIVEGIPSLPANLDLIVGVPRSGMLPASILSHLLDLPLTDVDGFLEGRLLRRGSSTAAIADGAVVDRARSVLVIDDSIGHGVQLQQVATRIAPRSAGRTLYLAAVFATPSGAALADIVFERLPWGRVFSWNLLHHRLLAECWVAADGILWDRRSAPSHDNDPAPIWRPTTRIGWIVTAQPATEVDRVRAWLEAHSITYDRLVMSARPLGAPATLRYMARGYRRSPARLFITDEAEHAQQVLRRAGAPTVSLLAQELYVPGLHRRIVTRLHRQLRRVAR